MKERPIIFSGPMVCAILDGRKTITRRVIKENVFDYGTNWTCNPNEKRHLCLYGKPGDRLWVREALCGNGQPGNKRAGVMRYAADGEMVTDEHGEILWPYKEPIYPAMFMPRWASRITLDVTDVKAERLQDISEAHVQNEGFHYFSELWDYLNAQRPRYSWNDNPWVWAISFRRIEA